MDGAPERCNTNVVRVELRRTFGSWCFLTCLRKYRVNCPGVHAPRDVKFNVNRASRQPPRAASKVQSAPDSRPNFARRFEQTVRGLDILESTAAVRVPNDGAAFQGHAIVDTRSRRHGRGAMELITVLLRD